MSDHKRPTVQVDEVFFLRLIEVMRYQENHEHGGDWHSEVSDLLSYAMAYMSPELKALKSIGLKEETKYRNRRQEMFPTVSLASEIGEAKGWEKDAASDSSSSSDSEF